MYLTDNCVFEIKKASADSLMTTLFASETSHPWEINPVSVGGFQVVPHGTDNNLPDNLRTVMEENNLAPGILRRKVQLLWGQGPMLYKENGTERQWVTDPGIMKWLKSWDYRNYLLALCMDFYHAEIVYSKVFRNKGARIGEAARVAKLEHVSVSNARFEFPGKGKRYPRRVIVGDFKYETSGLTPYPILNPERPLASPVEMFYSRMPSFGRNWYNTPVYYGGLNWIGRSSATPRILKHLTDNSLNIKWHVKSPQSFWERKAEMLKEKCQQDGTKYTDQALEEYKRSLFEKLSEVMGGEANVGKFFTSEVFYNEVGQKEEWVIEAIDQKVKDYIDAQIAISKQANYATTSSMGLHPALSNVSDDAKTNAGSQQLYALKLHLFSEVAIPEMLVMEAINMALDVNFGGEYKMGFYHDIVLREESVTPENRMTNAI